jgi:hypothetical protein
LATKFLETNLKQLEKVKCKPNDISELFYKKGNQTG